MIDPTGYDAIVNAVALVYVGRASVLRSSPKVTGRRKLLAMFT
jgi:hypothetical protein